MKAMLLVGLFAWEAMAATVICKSEEKVDGWTGTETHDFLRFTAYVTSNTELSKAQVKGAYVSDQRDLVIEEDYQPKSGRYKSYHRFGPLEDAWNWFRPLLPKDVMERKAPFTGFVQIMGEESYKGTVRLSCFLKD